MRVIYNHLPENPHLILVNSDGTIKMMINIDLSKFDLKIIEEISNYILYNNAIKCKGIAYNMGLTCFIPEQ